MLRKTAVQLQLAKRWPCAVATVCLGGEADAVLLRAQELLVPIEAPQAAEVAAAHAASGDAAAGATPAEVPTSDPAPEFECHADLVSNFILSKARER